MMKSKYLYHYIPTSIYTYTAASLTYNCYHKIEIVRAKSESFLVDLGLGYLKSLSLAVIAVIILRQQFDHWRM